MLAQVINFRFAPVGDIIPYVQIGFKAVPKTRLPLCNYWLLFIHALPCFQKSNRPLKKGPVFHVILTISNHVPQSDLIPSKTS